MGLISLVYVSSAKNQFSDDELKALLKKSRENNSKLDITGMLLHRGKFFIQLLEGEEEAVLALMDKIKADDRHGSLVVVHTTKITERTFSDWSMGFNKIDNQALSELEGFTDFLTRPMTTEFFSAKPNFALSLLNSFRNRSFF